ncbi:DNA repair protein RecO [Corynebacterium aquatimens]|uniref:DNA repair protein RecO n=1 Tax=Corynebacterium TaxID=1716 RepID=UPI001F36AFBD|nr:MULTISPECIES: DNA repair protein RecO [Corynebacterium]QYH19391.1 DNA repair protein RecO [Corynebacterium aquatimens]UIZ91694.1 DNA repair protein RecO [Corynebacterium sp. CNCTC7651]
MASRPSWRDRALVVRTYDFGEADRVIVLLTRNHGLVRGVAKGVRKAKSRFGSRLQPFVDIDVQVYPPRDPSRGLATITGADTVTYYGHQIVDDFDRYTAACAVMETAEKLAFDEADPQLFDLVGAALNRLRAGDHPTLALDAFILQATHHAGWGLSLFNCANCAAPGPHKAFNPAVGGAVCTNCRPPGSFDMDREALHTMWLLQHGHAAGADHVAQVHRATSAHLQFNLETGVSSLRVMEQA